MKVSKNQLVCARCHFVGLTSGIDWIDWSSGVRLAASASLSRRTVSNRSSAAWRFAVSAGCCAALSNTSSPRPVSGSLSDYRCQRFGADLVALSEIAGAQVALETRRPERLPGGALDEFRGRQQRALRMHAVAAASRGAAQNRLLRSRRAAPGSRRVPPRTAAPRSARRACRSGNSPSRRHTNGCPAGSPRGRCAGATPSSSRKPSSQAPGSSPRPDRRRSSPVRADSAGSHASGRSTSSASTRIRLRRTRVCRR